MREEMLQTLFASAARAAVIRVLMLDPGRPYYQRQLEHAAGLPIRSVQRELERLTGLGLLYRRTEGNRAYYHVDTGFALFPELRSMVLKASEPADALRGHLAMQEGCRLAFLNEASERVLLVRAPGAPPLTMPEGPFRYEQMSSEDFLAALDSDQKRLEPFLAHGVDLLGRRDDVVWARIEGSGYSVPKGAGVP